MQRTRVSPVSRLLISRLQPARTTTVFCVASANASTTFLDNYSVWRTVAALHTSCRFASSSSSSSSAAAAARAGQRSHYRSLGVDTDATPQEVKAAYRQLALRYHPDVAAEEHRAQAEVLFRRVSEAYEVLSDPVKRRAHDNELGIQTRRKQTASTGAAATAAAGASPASSPAGSTRGTWTSRGAARQKRRAASAAAAQSGSAQHPQQPQQQKGRSRYRKPFVRGDANRVFADAFDGKTLDEILFDVQRRRRQASAAEGKGQPQTQSGDASSVSASSSSSLPDVALGRDARLRHVMEDAAESFAHKAQRQYGHGILRHIRASASGLPEGPAAPPEPYMPFRPFVGMAVPAGVRTPPEPQLGHVLTPQDATMEAKDQDGAGAATGGGGSAVRIAGQFYTPRYADGMPHTRQASLSKATKNIEGMPHNMGQLYSYHRPY